LAKLTLNDITSGYASTTAVNANNAAIETALENTLSRDGTGPNQMGAALDMNGNLILNQGNPITINGFNWEGPWVTGTTYQVGDVVETGGTSYICIVEHTASALFATDSASWQTVAEASFPTQAGNAARFLQTNGTTATWEVPDSTEISFIQSGTGAVATTIQAKVRETIHVSDFGASTLGTAAEQTAAIQKALNLTRDVLVLDFGGHVYTVTDSGNAAFTGLNYALKWAGSGVLVLKNGGVHLNTHAKLVGLWLGEATGRVILDPSFKMTCATRTTTTHLGPVAISYGEQGATGANGTLESLDVLGCQIDGYGYMVHGHGCKRVNIHIKDSAQKGGGLYPTYVNEVVGLGSTNTAYKTEYCRIKLENVTPDPTYGDHAVYMLGEFGDVDIEVDLAGICTNDPIKLYGKAGDADWPSVKWGNIKVRGDVNGTTIPVVSSGWGVVLSEANKAENVDISINATGTTLDYYVYSEWATDSINVHNCEGLGSETSHVHIGPALSLGVNSGTVNISANNFGNYAQGGSNTVGIGVARADVLQVHGNTMEPDGVTTGDSINADPANVSVIYASNNACSKSPLWIDDRTKHTLAVHDINNGWESSVPAAITLTNGWSGSALRFDKIGTLVTMYGTADCTASTAATLGTLPAGFRPAGTLELTVVATAGATKTAGILSIANTGVISFVDHVAQDSINVGEVSFHAQL